MRVYLVQAGSDLMGTAGYCQGLLAAEQREILVSFLDMAGKRPTIFPNTKQIPRRELNERPSKSRKSVKSA